VVRAMDWSSIMTGVSTPFAPDGSVDLAGYERVLDHLCAGPLGGIVVNAVLSEGGQLSLTERVACVATAAQREKRPPVVATVYGASTCDAVAEARLVSHAGADCLLVYPHATFGGGSLDTDMIVGYYSALYEASGLPLVIFRTPDTLAPELGESALHALAATPGVVAVKDSVADPDFYTGSAAVFLTPESPLKIMADNDPMLLRLLRKGAHGGMSMVAAILPDAVAELAAHRDQAQADQFADAVQPLAQALSADPVRSFRARIKFLLSHKGVITDPAVRPPLLAPSPAEQQRLVQALRLTEANLDAFYAARIPANATV
jgi:4-hydroxy-tetrahydrodipicolinate synthase